jgi:hypothetical protein
LAPAATALGYARNQRKALCRFTSIPGRDHALRFTPFGE